MSFLFSQKEVVEFEHPKQPVTIEEKIEYYFPEEPELMKKIFTCESELNQFNEDGSPLGSPTNDWGVAQINAPVWSKTALQLGLDYKGDVDDNLRMARHVYEVQGVTAWSCYYKV